MRSGLSNTFYLKKMQHFELNGQLREVGNKATIKAFRKQGLVPCNLYGAGVENVLFTVKEKDLKEILSTPKSFIIDLVLDKKYEAVLHELQFHPVNDNCLHVDFLIVDAKKPVSIEVPVLIQGHAVGVQQGGKFYQSARKLRISALPENLPDEIPIEITSLGLDKKIVAGDVKLDKIAVLSDKDMTICGVRTTRNVSADAVAAAGQESEAAAE